MPDEKTFRQVEELIDRLLDEALHLQLYVKARDYVEERSRSNGENRS